MGEKIVPSVILEATHRNALRDGGVEKEELVKWKWNGEGGGAAKVQETIGR